MKCTTIAEYSCVQHEFFYYESAATKFTQPNEQSVGKIQNRLTACRTCDALFSIPDRRIMRAMQGLMLSQNRTGTLNPPGSTEMRIHLALRPTALFPARLRYF
jgi:hypothetical protein